MGRWYELESITQSISSFLGSLTHPLYFTPPPKKPRDRKFYSHHSPRAFLTLLFHPPVFFAFTSHYQTVSLHLIFSPNVLLRFILFNTPNCNITHGTNNTEDIMFWVPLSRSLSTFAWWSMKKSSHLPIRDEWLHSDGKLLKWAIYIKLLTNLHLVDGQKYNARESITQTQRDKVHITEQKFLIMQTASVEIFLDLHTSRKFMFALEESSSILPAKKNFHFFSFWFKYNSDIFRIFFHLSPPDTSTLSSFMCGSGGNKWEIHENELTKNQPSTL